MKRSNSLFASLVVPVFMLAVANPVMAQDKAKDAKAASAAKAAPAAKTEKGKITPKVLFENDKVRVVEATFKPGEEAANVARSFRVVRALKGGTLQFTYADGKTEKVEFKTGEVKARGPDPVATPKNIGKSDLVLYVVFVKEPKK